MIIPEEGQPQLQPSPAPEAGLGPLWLVRPGVLGKDFALVPKDQQPRRQHNTRLFPGGENRLFNSYSVKKEARWGASYTLSI